MLDWIRSNAFELITATVAAYAALLSTFQFVASRRDKRSRLRVQLNFGMLGFGAHLSEQQVFADASNTGHRPVSLKSVALAFPDGGKLFILDNHSEPRMPCKLEPGENVRAWFDLAEVKRALHDHGIDNASVRAFFSDGEGREYLSAPKAI